MLNIKYNGLYRCDLGVSGIWDYIRFYKNCIVITGLHKEDIQEAGEWMTKSRSGNGYILKSNYEVDGSSITFSINDEIGLVKYNCLIKRDSLIVETFRLKTQEKKVREYHFVNIESLSEDDHVKQEGKILNYDGEWEEQFLFFEKLDDSDAIKNYPLGKFGEMILIYEKKDKELIDTLDKHWQKLEGELVKSLEEMVNKHERYGHLKVKYFQAMGSTIKEDERDDFDFDWNINLSFNLLTNPDAWDFYIKDDKIIDYRATF